MSFPSLIRGIKFVEKDGTLSVNGANFLGQMSQMASQSINNEGLFVPKQTGANILLLNTAQSVGSFIFNTTTNAMMVNNTGTYVDIST